MVGRKNAVVPNKSSSESEHTEADLNSIVLRPVSPSGETASSKSERPRRVKKKWPPRSPSPSPPRERKAAKLIKLDEIEVVKEEENFEEEVGQGGDVAEEGFEVEGSQEAVDCLQVSLSEGAETNDDDEVKRDSRGRRVRSKGQLWKHVCSLPSEEMFQKWKLESEQNISPARWTKKRLSVGKTGTKRFFQCNAPNCKAELSVFYPHHSEATDVAYNGKKHFHPPNVKRRGIPAEVKQEIRRLWESGLRKPRLIKASLDKAGLGNCTRDQLSNFLERIKRNSNSRPETPSLSMIALDKWCTDHSISQPTAALDGDIDRVYVFDHSVNVKTQQFRLALSSKRLMGLAAQASTLNLDASHSMKWFGASVLFVGVSDASGQFFPVLFAVMSEMTESNYSHLLSMLKQCVEAGSRSKFRPRCVIGHDDQNLTEAVNEVFPSAVRRVCWLQVKKETSALLKHVDKEIRDACEKDLSALRLSCNKEQFELAAKLMVEKWRGLLPSSGAPGSFEERFVKLNPGWYEGFDIASYSSNKNLMHAVNAVRNRHTLRERLPIDRYLGLALELVLEWSVAVSETDELRHSVEPDKTLLHETCQLQNEQKTMVDVNAAIYVPTGDRDAATADDVDVYEDKMSGEVNSFDEFMEARMSLWKVEDPGNRSDLSHMRCTCPRFFSGKLCEHVLAIGSAFGLYKLPQSAWDEFRGFPKKRGRPPKKEEEEEKTKKKKRNKQLAVDDPDIQTYMEQEYELVEYQ